METNFMGIRENILTMKHARRLMCSAFLRRRGMKQEFAFHCMCLFSRFCPKARETAQMGNFLLPR